jgi:hypothetical protein
MTSPEWRDLSINARRAMDRLLIEHVYCRSEANGKLRVSYGQFMDHGICGPRHVGRALDELTAAGLVEITKGTRTGKFEGPNQYRITFHGTLEDPATWQPSNVIPFPAKPRERLPSFKAILAGNERIRKSESVKAYFERGKDTAGLLAPRSSSSKAGDKLSRAPCKILAPSKIWQK